MKLYFMLAYVRGAPTSNPVLVEMLDLLRQRGCEVELGIGTEMVLDPGQVKLEHDLYILKSHTSLWLSLAAIYHGQGARMLNPYLSCVACHNKIVAERRLRAARIPTPHAWVTGDLNLLRATVEERPLFLKPYIGGRGAGVRLVQSAAELAALPLPDQPMLVQEYVPGQELKIYVIGQEVFAIRKPGSPDDSTREIYPLSDDTRAIALQCGQAFGLGLYGLDVIESPDGPVVIDLNYFPSYKGVPDAANLLAEYIEGYASGAYPELMPARPETATVTFSETASVWAMRWP